MSTGIGIYIYDSFFSEISNFKIKIDKEEKKKWKILVALSKSEKKESVKYDQQH